MRDVSVFGGRALVHLESIEGTGAAQTLYLQPSEGKVWLVMWAKGEHNDNGGARTVEWFLDDGVIGTAQRVRAAVSVATGIHVPLFDEGCEIPFPLVLSAGGLKLACQFTGVVAGKYLAITALIREYYGVVGGL